MHIDVKREIKKSPMGKIGLIILVTIIAMAIIAPFWSPYDPFHQSATSLLPPSLEHWLGMNHVGQDIWSQLVYGARTSLMVGFSVGALATLLATAAGVSAALIGGLYERIVMRVIDTLIIIPMVIVVILISAYIRPGIVTLILLLSIFSWQGGARIIRAQALSLKEKGHIAAARSFGASWFYIAWRHIIPDLGPILLVDFVYNVRRAVFLEAGLAFLGISDPNVMSWGTMMRDALSYVYLDVWKWWLIPPGIALSLTIIGLTFVGHAAEPVIEPRFREVSIA